MKKYKVKTVSGEYNLYFKAERYNANDTLAVDAYDAKDNEWFGTITVNLSDPRQIEKNHAFFDINNFGKRFLDQLVAHGLAEMHKDGYTRTSGWVEYPLVKWNTKKF